MKIVIADQEPTSRSALAMLISAQPDLELAGDVGDIADLLVKIKAERPDLVVLDWDVLGQRIDTLVDLLELFDDPPAIVALSVNEDAQSAAKVGGVVGFAYKGDPPSELLDMIRKSGPPKRSEPA